MRKRKKYKKLFGRKFEINLAGWGIGCCMLMLFCVPILGNTLGNETTYSEVLLDGEVIGAVADPEEVDQARCLQGLPRAGSFHRPPPKSRE